MIVGGRDARAEILIKAPSRPQVSEHSECTFPRWPQRGPAGTPDGVIRCNGAHC
jgi:hypothetical protein